MSVSTDINQAAKLIKEGELVAFPTETVYGLGADATKGEAVARIYEAKGRPSFNPLIVHVSDEAMLDNLVELNPLAKKIIHEFWPGPLTLILNRKENCPVSELCSAGLETLAVRMPAQKTARELISKAGVPIAAPSANKSGEISPTTPAHVIQSLGDNVGLVLASGDCEVGLESTVLDLSTDEPLILRPGAITAEDLSFVLDMEVFYDAGDKDKPKSPGQLLRHYAPNLPIRLNAIDLVPGEALLAFGSVKFMGIRGGGVVKDLPDYAYRNLSESGDLVEAASNLFRMLRELDVPENKSIAVMSIPERSIGVAINDRLARAAN
jgi:L-threonylcarbamoyladenylate synthase